MKKIITYLVSIIVFIIHPFYAQNIYTYAGTGNFGYSGDGGPALLADITAATGIVTDKKGNVYFCEWYYGLIRKVDTNGIITKVAGGGSTMSDLADGIPATTALVRHPWGLTIDSIGNLYFAEAQFNQVRKIDTLGIITTIAGVANMTGSFSGDGGLAKNAGLNSPSDVAIDKYGNVYIADASNHRVRKVDATGVINTIAGISGSGFTGDGGPAVNANLYYPLGVAVDRNSNIYIGDAGHRIRKIDTLGLINTIVGTGVQGNSGDGGLAINAKIGSTRGLELDSLGNLFFADRDYGVVRKVDSNGIITKIAGIGIGGGYSGDGGPATLAQFYSPIDVTFDRFGNLYVTDNGNQRIRKICSNIPLPVLSSMSVTCAAESVTLSVSGAGSYTWSTGSTNPIVIVTPTVNTTYTVNGADMVGCSYNAVFTQSVNPVPTLTVSATSNTMCASESVTVTATGANTYTWSTANTNPDIVVSPSVTTTYTVEGSNVYSCSASSVITIMVDPCVGIKEHNINNIKIYPNPAVNTLNISDENNAFENSTLEVTNYLGQTIIKQAYSNTVDVSKLPIGIYTLKIITLDKESYYSKFIKE